MKRPPKEVIASARPPVIPERPTPPPPEAKNCESVRPSENSTTRWGFFVVDSVNAAKGGNFRDYAVGWCENISDAIQTAEYLEEGTPDDYLIISAATGKVVG